MSNQIQKEKNQKYDLVDRSAQFGEDVIRLCKRLPENTINRLLISQLVRSATSIGANYMEADGGESRRDFQHKTGIAKKEAKETMHWLRMIATTNPDIAIECRKLWKEAHELTLILSAILRNSGKK